MPERCAVQEKSKETESKLADAEHALSFKSVTAMEGSIVSKDLEVA